MRVRFPLPTLFDFDFELELQSIYEIQSSGYFMDKSYIKGLRPVSLANKVNPTVYKKIKRSLPDNHCYHIESSKLSGRVRLPSIKK